MKTLLKPSILFITSALFANAAMSEVSTISSDSLVQYAKEQAYWVATVTCSDDSQRVIQRKTDGNEWCGKAVDGFCDADKEAAADRICGTQYTSALSLLEATKQAQNEAAEAEERARRAERERQEQLAAQQRQQQAERERQAATAPLKRQITIEEELIQIEQEKLNLRRQELELQRRASEIEALLEGKDA